MSVRVAVHILACHTELSPILDTCRELDELGADIIFVPDHFFPAFGDTDGKQFEGLTLLAAIASVTERAEIGGLVFCNSYRNPELLVDAHRTIDHIAGGRVILGVGAGWMQKDFEEYGYAYGTVGDRLGTLRRDLPRMKARLARLNPPPLRDMPLLIGGNGPNVTLHLVAEHARYWHSYGGVKDYVASVDILAGHCSAIGRDPGEITHVRGIVSPAPGIPGRIIEIADDLHAAGVGVISIAIAARDGGYDLERVRELLAWRDRVAL